MLLGEGHLNGSALIVPAVGLTQVLAQTGGLWVCARGTNTNPPGTQAGWPRVLPAPSLCPWDPPK